MNYHALVSVPYLDAIRRPPRQEVGSYHPGLLQELGCHHRVVWEPQYRGFCIIGAASDRVVAI